MKCVTLHLLNLPLLGFAFLRMWGYITRLNWFPYSKCFNLSVSQVVINKDDPIFQNSTESVGEFYSEEETKKLEKGLSN